MTTTVPMPEGSSPYLWACYWAKVRPSEAAEISRARRRFYKEQEIKHAGALTAYRESIEPRTLQPP